MSDCGPLITLLAMTTLFFEGIECQQCSASETLPGGIKHENWIADTAIKAFSQNNYSFESEKLHESILEYFKTQSGRTNLDNIVKLIFKMKTNDENEEPVEEEDEESDEDYTMLRSMKNGEEKDVQSDKYYTMLKNMTNAIRFYLPTGITTLFLVNQGENDSLVTEVMKQITNTTLNTNLLENYVMPVVDILWQKHSNEMFAYELANVLAVELHRKLAVGFVGDISVLLEKEFNGPNMPDKIAEFIITQIQKPGMDELLETLLNKLAGVFVQGESSIIECAMRQVMKRYAALETAEFIQEIVDLLEVMLISPERFVEMILDAIEKMLTSDNPIVIYVAALFDNSSINLIKSFLTDWLNLKLSDSNTIFSNVLTEENILTFVSIVLETIVDSPNLIEKVVNLISVFGKRDIDIAGILSSIVKAFV